MKQLINKLKESDLKYLPGYLLYNLTHPINQVHGFYCSIANDVGVLYDSYPESWEHLSFFKYMLIKEQEKQTSTKK